MARRRRCAVLATAALVSAAPACAAAAAMMEDQPFFGEEALARARWPNRLMTLHMMPDEGLAGRGAVCLDGSDAGFYFAPASNKKNQNDWQIYFQGGGWCYDELDCWGRSLTNLGSSKDWPKTSGLAGMLSDDCGINPDFCNFNRVHLAYCDGNSFSGDRDEPLEVIGSDGKPKKLYFRGRRIMDAVLSKLLKMGLDKAENVMLTGCSAGGLATYLHTDYVHNFLRSANVPLKKFRSAPISGFFLLHKTVGGKSVYPQEMQHIFNLANSTGGLNANCIAAMKPEDAWMCNFAQYAYMYTESQIFPLNSALDSWQTKCIFTSELPSGFPAQNNTHNGECGQVKEYRPCLDNLEKCTEDQMAALNQYILDFSHTMEFTGTYHKAGNGAFIHSCHTHCEAQSENWNTFKNGGLTMQQAFSKWWHSEGEPSASHSYGSCLYHPSAVPHRCDPTCYSVAAGAEQEDVLMVV